MESDLSAIFFDYFRKKKKNAIEIFSHLKFFSLFYYDIELSIVIALLRIELIFLRTSRFLSIVDKISVSSSVIFFNNWIKK